MNMQSTFIKNCGLIFKRYRFHLPSNSIESTRIFQFFQQQNKNYSFLYYPR